jgi:copper homeostasis protein
MADDIRAAKELGADGVVLGVLTAGRAVDARAMAPLLRAARPMGVTFHRAFDDIPRRADALEALVDLGVERVLTAGGAPNAFDGRREIGRLAAQAAGRIAVMAGGGVGRWTVMRLLAESGVREVHIGSAVATVRNSGRGAYRTEMSVVSESKVKSMVRLLRTAS